MSDKTAKGLAKSRLRGRLVKIMDGAGWREHLDLLQAVQGADSEIKEARARWLAWMEMARRHVTLYEWTDWATVTARVPPGRAGEATEAIQAAMAAVPLIELGLEVETAAVAGAREARVGSGLIGAKAGSAGGTGPASVVLVGRETFAGRTCSMADAVKWVADNIRVEVEANHSPGPAAWGLLMWARQSQTNENNFWTSILPRFMAKESSAESKFRDDGRDMADLEERLIRSCEMEEAHVARQKVARLAANDGSGDGVHGPHGGGLPEAGTDGVPSDASPNRSDIPPSPLPGGGQREADSAGGLQPQRVACNGVGADADGVLRDRCTGPGAGDVPPGDRRDGGDAGEVPSGPQEGGFRG